MPTNLGTDHDKYPKIEPGAPAYELAMSIENSARAVRKAQGKKNPEDCVLYSEEWQAVDADFERSAAGAGRRSGRIRRLAVRRHAIACNYEPVARDSPEAFRAARTRPGCFSYSQY
jgi:hypothetical protein